MELRSETTPGQGKKNPAIAVYNSSFELILETGGTRRGAFDVQLRPVGRILVRVPLSTNYGSRT